MENYLCVVFELFFPFFPKNNVPERFTILTLKNLKPIFWDLKSPKINQKLHVVPALGRVQEDPLRTFRRTSVAPLKATAVGPKAGLHRLPEIKISNFKIRDFLIFDPLKMSGCRSLKPGSGASSPVYQKWSKRPKSTFLTQVLESNLPYSGKFWSWTWPRPNQKGAFLTRFRIKICPSRADLSPGPGVTPPKSVILAQKFRARIAHLLCRTVVYIPHTKN